MSSSDKDKTGRPSSQEPGNTSRLSLSRELGERLMETANVVVVGLDAEGKVDFFNEAAERTTGYTKAEVLGRSWFDFLASRDRNADLLGLLRQLQAGGAAMSQVCESPIITKAGEERHISWQNSRICKQDRFAGIISVGLDITERKRVEQKLRLSDQILQNVGALVLVGDATGRITYVSPSARTILGYEPEELLGEGWWNLTRDEPSERQREREHVVHSAPFWGKAPAEPYERSVKHRNGELRWIAWQDAPGPDGSVIGVGHDITQRKSLERQLIQSQKMEAVGTLAGGIAHDFNNLLTAINGYSELALGMLPPQDPLRSTLEEIRKAGERAAGLTRQLLAFSRRQVMQPQIIDLSAVATGIHDMLRRLIGENVTLTTQLAADPVTAKADPGQIEQVIVNLAVNARDAMPQGGRLTIETANVDMTRSMLRKHPGMPPGSYAMLAVTDTGVGMDAEVQAHIFEPFFTTKEVGKGTGLGLSTAYGIMKQSGGYIYFTSAADRGTTFRVYLPRVIV